MPLMALIILVGVFVGLDHWRRTRFTQDYIELVARVDSDNSPAIEEKLYLLEDHLQNTGLRRGIMSLILGLTAVAIPLATDLITDRDGAAAMIVCGLIVCAFGVGNLVTWRMIDVPRFKRMRQMRKNS